MTIPLLGLSEPAAAQTFGPGGNVYPGGISVGSADTPISVTLETGVVVDILAGSTSRAVALDSTSGGVGTGGPATLFANNAAITIDTRSFSPPDTSALFVHAAGDATIGGADNPVSAIMNVTGATSTNAVWASVFSTVAGATASVTYAGPTTGPGITETGGSNSTLIQACANDGCGFGNVVNGDAVIDAAGNLTGVGKSAPATTGMNGLFAVAGGNGDATVNYHRGTIDISQTDTGIVAGIFAASGDVGSATITTDPGTAVTVSGQGSALFGIDAFASGGASTADVASTILIDGSPTTTNRYRRNPSGIIATSDPNATSDPIGSASVSYTGPGITVRGGGGLGIVAVAGSPDGASASGPVTVDASGASGPIVADGSNAIGILADSGTIRNFVADENPPTTTTGAVLVNASHFSASGKFGVSIQGQYGVGISATGGSGGVAVNIPSAGSVMGGWQLDVNSVGPTYGLPAAGVILGSSVGAATLTNNGAIGALSDRAIASPLPSYFGASFPTSNNTTITNNGTITGFVQLLGGNNSIVNNGTFNLRHFADTTGATDSSGNGVRDTVRVALANLGFGLNNRFANNGTLALPQVTGAKTSNSDGEYLPLGNANNAMGLNGPLQGQMLGVSTFTNSGVIDLQSDPKAGDVLVITGANLAAVPVPSTTSFPGVFISNGGSLLLDTVLNEGGAATRSDTLVVDGVGVGPGGATRTFINNAGGAGLLTVGDGILVVEVLDKARSAAGAFALANGPLNVGPFEYQLFQGGFSAGSTGNWYLRSDFRGGGGDGGTTPPEPEPIPPEPEPIPPEQPPVVLPPDHLFPIIGPRLATYGVVQPLARQWGLTTLGTLHERLGDTYQPDCVAPAPCPPFGNTAWARFLGGTIDNEYEAFADPRAHGKFWGFQGGIDLMRESWLAGHYERAGLYAAYGQTNADIDGLITNPAATAYIQTHTGAVNFEAWSLGGYWTHVGPGGWYLDAVVQGTGYSGHAKTPISSLPTNGWGFLASLEGGYPFPVWFWPRLVLEPQVQIIWQHVGFLKDFDGIDAIEPGATSGWTGRLGLLAESTIVTDSGKVWQPYFRANLWHDWGAQAASTFEPSPIRVLLDEAATRLELAGGGTVKVYANWSAYIQAGYQFAVGSSDVRRNGFTGDIGIRYNW
jgi:hypothetical protein